jgi:O-antigen ligase
VSFPRQLVSPLLGCSLALALVPGDGFGGLLALILIIGLFSLRSGELAALRAQDRVFLMLFNVYPLLVAFSMLLHGLRDVGLFDNAARFLLLSVVYLTLRAESFDMRYVIVGAVVGCGVAFSASVLHLMADPQLPQARGRIVGSMNAVVFAQTAFFLLLVALTPTKTPGPSLSRTRLLLLVVVVVASISLVVSQSRVVLVALVALYVYLFLHDERLPGGSLATCVLLLCGACAVVYLVNAPFFYHLAGTTSELVANLGQIDPLTSLGQRLALWSSSWQMILEKPFFGFGIGQFNEALSSLPGAASLTATVRSYSHAHNDFLQLAVEQGLVGLTVFLLALAAIPFLALHEKFAADARYLLVGSVSCWLFFGLTHTQLAHQKTTLMFAVLLMLGFSHGMNGKYGPLDSNDS